jgi:sugar/nucleoside kinase (ribokinase family)
LSAVDLTTVGDVMLDVRVDAGALARGGDVHGRVVVRAGGTSANAAVWAAWAGASARVHGRVGDDLTGRLLERELADRDVEPALSIDPDAPTGTMLVVHEAGERSMVADRGANARLVPEDLPDRITCEALLVSGYLLLQDAGRDAALAALERADAVWIAVDAASWPMVEAAGVGRFFSDAARANVIFANEQEVRVLTEREGEDAARALGERVRVAAVKLGAGGAAMSFDGTLVVAPGEPVAELDPTGAGDAFDGVLLAELARGAEPQRALDRACHAGAIVAASAGTWPDRGSRP